MANPDDNDLPPPPVDGNAKLPSKYTMDEFVRKTSEKSAETETFELESDYMLEINLNGKVWTKWGSMTAYTGNIKFKNSTKHRMGSIY